MKIVAAAALAASLAVPAWAQNNCIPRDAAVDTLANRCGESPVVGGLSERGVFLEVWANEETGSWTAVITTPDGVSCLVDAGDDFARFEPIPGGDPA